MNAFNKQVLSDMISAYRKGYSCQSSLFKLCEEIRHAMDHSEIAAMILMDLSKAFDCLPHDLMVAKLTAYGCVSLCNQTSHKLSAPSSATC